MGQRTVIVGIAIVIFAVIFTAILVVSRLSSSRPAKPSETPQAVQTNTTVGNILSDPVVYDELGISVEAGISDWVTKRSFTLSAGESGVFGGSQGQILVIAKNEFKLPQTQNQEELGLGQTVNVRVKGRVEIMNKEQLAKALGVDIDSDEFKLDDNNFEDWKLGTVILLDQVEKI